MHRCQYSDPCLPLGTQGKSYCSLFNGSAKRKLVDRSRLLDAIHDVVAQGQWQCLAESLPVLTSLKMTFLCLHMICLQTTGSISRGDLQCYMWILHFLISHLLHSENAPTQQDTSSSTIAGRCLDLIGSQSHLVLMLIMIDPRPTDPLLN